MKTVLLLAGLVALVAGGSLPPSHDVETKPVDQDFVVRQKKVFSLLRHIQQIDRDSEYYKIGYEYDIEANIGDYTNKKAVEEFLLYYKHHGFLPKGLIFSVFYENMREQAVALYHLFYYAKDFETFYKTAAWARANVNEGLFVYSFSIAIIHRQDTSGLVLPAPYEIYPYFFVNSEVIQKLYVVKMKEGKLDPKLAPFYGIHVDGNVYTVYANYSGYDTWYNSEHKLSYFTEDIGLNTYYYYFHKSLPFWMKGDEFGWLKQRRGEIFYYFHQQLLARYYMERLTNGMGEIPEFSWNLPIKTGYYPSMSYLGGKPFTQRNDYYYLERPEYTEALQIIQNYESQFLEYVHEGQFKGYGDVHIDLKKPEAINFVGNYWQSNPDAFNGEVPKHYNQYYEVIARVLLGGNPHPTDDEYIGLAALEKFQTSLRDPVFWQLYKRILFYFLQYKQYLEPYTKEQLGFTGVKVSKVKVDKLVTFYDYFDFDATNAVYYKPEDLKQVPYAFRVRQPRLNHKAFDVKISVKSDVATEAVFKVFLAPKYDGNGNPISFAHNYMNFFELDGFVQKLVVGRERYSSQLQTIPRL
ncbi:Arylphorin subunit alpha [Eumeta japonica]|uniref:Arylphorin subunit alpha n=1 Tax=Eumeta variegata TaxID=151549 RepID=A0A4C1SJR9_EUMVA|nr:Arylphorin subunit alpha [Eumeta japonica]